MKRDLESLRTGLFDVAIIGGGITGACLAHDLSLRGRKVALVEKADFGGATSSASSRLIHGGIRYLPKAQFHKVRESARERAIFQNLAPHLTRYVPFVIPTFTDNPMKGKLAMGAGMAAYSLACAGLDDMIRDPVKKVPADGWLSRSDLSDRVPELAHLKRCNGAWLLYESHMHSSERMTLAFVKTAVSNGAVAANYLEATSLVSDGGRFRGVRVRDRMTGEVFTVRARLAANAAGPFIPEINDRFGGLRLSKPVSGFARGVHMVTRQIHPTHAMALTTEKKTEGLVTRGGRHVFVIPWGGRSLIGTTNAPHRGPAGRVRVLAREVADFLLEINQILPNARLRTADVRYAFSGIYPLTASVIRPDTYQGSGDYQVVDHGRRGRISGVFSVLGAKYTTARKLAQIAADRMEVQLGGTEPCRTQRTPLREGRIDNLAGFDQAAQSTYGNCLSPRQIRHLTRAYGSDLDGFVAFSRRQPEGLAPLDGQTDGQTMVLCAQVRYAVDREMAQNLTDVVFRRTGMGVFGRPDPATLNQAASLMAEMLDWGPERTRSELARAASHYDYPIV